ncbi:MULTISPECIES: MFS transporter [Bacillaceae]|uniref:MFS transporter n=1 Tax=Bacillaceae TaxID=186817 RepID=UPI0011A7C6F4|nr:MULTISPECIES: MFS transporter [Bacillaceae]MCM3124646.1 MFS transporter [Mesobacillus sp. MER 33]MCM3234644.1 MFS transporter [Mesobacillus sp. MER 48]
MEGAIKKNLVLFLIGKVTSVLGSSIYAFAIGLYILAETGSSLNFAVTLVLSMLPRILLAPVAGTLSDRMDRKKIIIFSNFASSFWLAIILMSFLFFSQEIWILYVATTGLSIISTFYSIAVTSSIYNMVGPDHLQKAMSLNQAAISLSAILGPVLGGVFFGIIQIHLFMALNILTYLIAAFASILIEYNLFSKKTQDKKTTRMAEDLKQGISYIKAQPFLLHLVILSVWLNFWFAIFPVAMPYLVLTVRGMSSVQLGFIEGAFSVGMMIMALILSGRKEIRKKEFSIIGGMLILSAVLILIGLPAVPGFVGLSNPLIFGYLVSMVLVLSASIMFINTPVSVLLQKNTPDEYRGRVMALLETGSSAMTPAGFILFGFLLEKLPVWLLLAVCGFSLFAVVFYLYREKMFLKLLREEDKAGTASI